MASDPGGENRLCEGPVVRESMTGLRSAGMQEAEWLDSEHPGCGRGQGPDCCGARSLGTYLNLLWAVQPPLGALASRAVHGEVSVLIYCLSPASVL